MPKYNVLGEAGEFLGVVDANDESEALDAAKKTIEGAASVEERAEVIGPHGHS